MARRAGAIVGYRLILYLLVTLCRGRQQQSLFRQAAHAQMWSTSVLTKCINRYQERDCQQNAFQPWRHHLVTMVGRGPPTNFEWHQTAHLNNAKATKTQNVIPAPMPAHMFDASLKQRTTGRLRCNTVKQSFVQKPGTKPTNCLEKRAFSQRLQRFQDQQEKSHEQCCE
jgi:hypothetical protein